MEQWHPILAAEEGPTGTWRLIDGTGKIYGTIEIRRVMNGTDVRYRAVFRGEVIGWATSLRVACEQIHRVFLRAHGPGGGAIADWGGTVAGAPGGRSGRPDSSVSGR